MSISERDRAIIKAAVARLDISSWRGLNDAEADLVRRALFPELVADEPGSGQRCPDD